MTSEGWGAGVRRLLGGRRSGDPARREELLAEGEQRFKLLVDNSSDVITVVGPDDLVYYQSPSVKRVLGYEPEELVGAPVTDIIHPDDRARAEAFFDEAKRRLDVTGPVEWRLRRRDGSWLPAEMLATNSLSVPAINGLVLTTREVSGRKVLEEALMHQTLHDPLTGLANRALFADHLEYELERARRTRNTIAVLLCDLDDFKTINDSMGPAAGDQLLVALTQRLRRTIRSADHLARLGGDEFAFLITDLQRGSDARAAADRVLEAFDEPFVVGGRELTVRASLGIAGSISGQERPDELLRNADVAMYAAKRGGKNRIDTYLPAMHEAAVERLELQADLQRALDRDELVVHYQPMFVLASGEVAGMEALVRWNHPSRGLMPPLSFIPLAEETDLILAIGRWVLRRACRQAVAWSGELPLLPSASVAVNLSARHLQDPGLVDDVVDALSRSGLAPSRLLLEITESLLLVDNQRIAEALEQLTTLGVRMAIDDFGTGYSSLSYLERLPVSAIKIDRSFIEAIGRGTEASALTAAIVRMGQDLHLETVAEGIETQAQHDLLQALGCTLGQGDLLCPALAPEEVAMRLAASPRGRRSPEVSERAL